MSIRPDLIDQIKEEMHEDYMRDRERQELGGHPRAPRRLPPARHCPDCGHPNPERYRCYQCELAYDLHMQRARRWDEEKYQRYVENHR